MYEPSAYLQWARRHYGVVTFDMASSGIPAPPPSLLELPESLDDLSALGRWRYAIAAYNDVPVENVVQALGTSHAVWLAYASVIKPGDDVVIETPTYGPLEQAARALGAHLVPFRRPPEEDYALDPDRVAAAMTPKTRAVIVTNLHNPSGRRATAETLKAVAAVAAKRGAALIVDEVYAPFDDFIDAAGVFRGSSRNLAPNIVAVGSLTKCYGLGLARYGWILASPEVAQQADHVLTLSMGNLPLPHANLAAAAFAKIHDLADHARRSLAGKRAIVEAWMATRPDLRWSGPPEGLFGFAIRDGAGDLTPVIERGIAERDVIVAAGAFFGIPNGFRLAWSLPEARLREGLTRLDAVLQR